MLILRFFVSVGAGYAPSITTDFSRNILIISVALVSFTMMVRGGSEQVNSQVCFELTYKKIAISL